MAWLLLGIAVVCSFIWKRVEGLEITSVTTHLKSGLLLLHGTKNLVKLVYAKVEIGVTELESQFWRITELESQASRKTRIGLRLLVVVLKTLMSKGASSRNVILDNC